MTDTFLDNNVSSADNRDSLKTSKAIIFLDECAAQGKLTHERADRLKDMFVDLNEAHLKTLNEDRVAHSKLKDLLGQLTKQRAQSQQLSDSSASGALQQSAQNLVKAEMDGIAAQNSLHIVQMEKEFAEQTLQDKKLEVERKEERDKNSKQPEVLRKIENLKRERARVQAQEQKLRAEKKANEAKLADCRAKKEEQLQAVGRLRTKELRSRDEFIKEKRNLEKRTSGIKDVEDQVSKISAQLDGAERKLADKKRESRKIHDSINVLNSEGVQYDSARRASAKRNQDTERVIQELARQRLDKDQTNANLEAEIKALTKKVKKLTKELGKESKRCSEARRKHYKLQSEKDIMEALLPEMRMELQKLKDRLAKESEHRANAEQKLAAAQVLKKQHISKTVGQGKRTDSRKVEVASTMAEIESLEGELSDLQRKERSLASEMNDVSVVREHTALACTKLARKLREAQDMNRMNVLVSKDYDKQIADIERQIREREVFFNVVKNDRNKYVNMLQRGQQEAAEFNEKLKILANEIEILHAEISAKDRELVANSLAHKDACTQRDALRIEVNKFLFGYEKMRDVIDQQLAEIERLNATINQAEKDMVLLRRAYEQAVEDRNATGIQLIDRNDELCILYEKSNIQEKFLRQGEIEIREREEELRVLALKCNELRRQHELYAPKASTRLMEELKTQVMLLTFELENEQAIAEKLARDLVNPRNEERFRVLEGKDLKTEVLHDKMETLEERLNNKEEQLLEKTLVLDELTNLSNRERARANENSMDTLELAKKVNDFQARIRNTTRKIMATLSELSIYKFNVLQTQQEIQEMAYQVEEGLARLERGEAPTAAAANEWDRYLTRLARDRDARERRTAEAEYEEIDGPPSMAAARVNAYLPHHTTGLLPIPKPFLFPRMEPSATGSSMRHIRPPQPKPIEI